MSVDKIHLATIFEFFNLKNMFDAFNQKYFASNTARFHQLLYNCKTIGIQKNIEVMKKYELMLNLNAKIRMQKPKLIFPDKYLTNFFLVSMLFIYKKIINNLIICNILTLEEKVCAFCIKKTKFINLRIIKKESAHFTI